MDTAEELQRRLENGEELNASEIEVLNKAWGSSSIANLAALSHKKVVESRKKVKAELETDKLIEEAYSKDD